MTRTLSKTILPIIIAMLVFTIAFPAQADGKSEGLTETVNGYHVSLVFLKEPIVGENQIHVQIHDAMDMPVGDATVEVTLTRVENENGHGQEEEASGHDNMSGTHATMGGFVLAPSHHEAGEYYGEIDVESTGDWTVTVHLTVQDQGMEVEFPLMLQSSSRNIILASFAGVNLLILAAAAILKRKPAAK